MAAPSCTNKKKTRRREKILKAHLSTSLFVSLAPGISTAFARSLFSWFFSSSFLPFCANSNAQLNSVIIYLYLRFLRARSRKKIIFTQIGIRKIHATLWGGEDWRERKKTRSQVQGNEEFHRATQVMQTMYRLRSSIVWCALMFITIPQITHSVPLQASDNRLTWQVLIDLHSRYGAFKVSSWNPNASIYALQYIYKYYIKYYNMKS